MDRSFEVIRIISIKCRYKNTGEVLSGYHCAAAFILTKLGFKTQGTEKNIREIIDKVMVERDDWYMQPYPSAKDGFSDERLLAGLDKLGETYRLIIELDFLEELPNRAIADLMDLSEKTVRNYNFFMIYSIFERVLLLLQIRAGCFHSLR